MVLTFERSDLVPLEVAKYGLLRARIRDQFPHIDDETLADTLEGRVLTRLRWDKQLRDAAIEVHADEGVVELRGNVADEKQKQWAVQLAESTVGVERVTDNLTVGTP